MKNSLSFFGCLLFTVACSQGAILYNYQFETSDPTVNSGSGASVASATGSITSGVGVGASGFFGDFDGGNVAGADHMDVSVAGDAISLGNFRLTFSVNDSAATVFDDFIGLSATGGFNIAFEREGPNDTLVVFEVGNNSGAINSTGTLTAGSWVTYTAVGSTSGADAVIELFANGSSAGSSTYVGGASEILQTLRVGGRVGVDNRYIDAGIDEVRLENIPEPATSSLLGLGGLVLLMRRKK